MNVEAQAIDVPTGVQDYRPALYGGISAVELGVDGVRRVALPVDAPRARAAPRAGLHRRDPQLGHQQLGSHQAAHRRRPRGAATLRADPRHRRRDARARSSDGDWTEVGRQIADEWENRKGLAPGVTTPEIDAMLAAARRAGAYGGKVCGAGGGGCLFCLGEPDRIPGDPRGARGERRARSSISRIETEGLRRRDARSPPAGCQALSADQ